MVSAAPKARPGYMLNAGLAPESSSSTSTTSAWGAPCPPWSVETPSALKPFS